MSHSAGKRAVKFLCAVLLLIAIPASAQTTIRMGDKGVVTAQGTEHKENPDGRVSFIVNANDYLAPWKWPSFLSSKYTAVIFGGAEKDDRTCPYYGSHSRPRTISHLEYLTYSVSTTANPKEIEAVRKAGCIITESPTLKELGLEGKQPAPHHYNN